MKYSIATYMLTGVIALVSCETPRIGKQVPDCIHIPETADKSQKEISANLAADLVAGIGKPSLATTYKNNLDIAYAQLSQQNLQQLVLIEFLFCARTKYATQITPETYSVMDQALQRAIKKASGAESLRGPITAASKERLANTPYGNEKVSALEKIGH
jgi:hypothetical protein